MNTYNVDAALTAALERVNANTLRRVNSLRGSIRTRAFANSFADGVLCGPYGLPRPLIDRLTDQALYLAFA